MNLLLLQLLRRRQKTQLQQFQRCIFLTKATAGSSSSSSSNIINVHSSSRLSCGSSSHQQRRQPLINHHHHSFLLLRLFSSSSSSVSRRRDDDDDDHNNNNDKKVLLEKRILLSSSKDEQDEIEWKQRCELAACYRVSYLNGWHENIFNHITLKVANSDSLSSTTTSGNGNGGGPHFFINEFGVGFDEMTASNIIKVNLDGEVVVDVDDSNNNNDSNNKKKVFKPGYVIHSAIHQGRKDVHAIWHVHPIDTTAVCQTKFGLLQISQEASLALKRGISYHPFEGTANNIEEKSRLIQSLGPNNHILMLENHGPLLACPTLHQAFAGMFFLTRACTFQIKSLSSVGGDISKLHLPDLNLQNEMLQRSKKFDDSPIFGQTHDSDKLMYQYAIRNAENVFGKNNIYK